MTLADILQPCSTILIHAQLKGAQYGAGISALAFGHVCLIRRDVMNPSDDPPLVAIAKKAGTGAILGACVATTVATVKMAKLTKDELQSRAEKLHASEEESRLKKVAAVGSGIGLGLLGLRFSHLAEESGKTVRQITMTKDGLWEVFCFGALGAGIAVGVAKVSTKVVESLNERKETSGGDDVAAGEVDGAAATEDTDGAKGDATEPAQGE
eukprot:GFKZ01003210.1.p3 GENE.GFKZ01003210.1~~GFKZ01003210.1.p3  ORF type:complete len:211 (+),score=26.48 GFKZ01003210.1:120-752(+)